MQLITAKYLPPLVGPVGRRQAFEFAAVLEAFSEWDVGSERIITHFWIETSTAECGISSLPAPTGFYPLTFIKHWASAEGLVEAYSSLMPFAERNGHK